MKFSPKDLLPRVLPGRRSTSPFLIALLVNVQVLDWWETFFRTGSLIFGGGQVGRWRLEVLFTTHDACIVLQTGLIHNAIRALCMIHHDEDRAGCRPSVSGYAQLICRWCCRCSAARWSARGG